MMPIDMWYIISILMVLHQQMLLTLQQGETCPYAFASEQHGESCYYFSPSSTALSEASSCCVKYDFHLVFIETAEEEDFIEGRVEENSAGDYWIGLTVDSDGQSVWLDGSSLTYDNTRSNSFNAGGECFRITASSGHIWHDIVCAASYRYVCEKENACPDATEQHGESCYYFSTSPMTRSQAFLECSKYGFHLVYIETAEEQDFIEGRVEENNDGDYWIGLTVDSDGQGVWLGGSSLTYVNTRSSSYDDGGECFRMVASNGYWHDRNCSKSYRYVCEKENECSTKTTVATTELVTTTATTTTTQQPSTTTVTTTTQATTTKPTTQPSTTTSATTTTTTASPKARQRSNRYKMIAQNTAIMDSAVVKRDSASTLIRCAALCLAMESCSCFTFSADNGDCLLGGVAPKDKDDLERRLGAKTFEAI